MLADIYIYGLTTVTAFVLFWSCPADRPEIRRRMLTVVSMLAVCLYSPVGFLICLYLVCVPLLAQGVFSRVRRLWAFWAFVALTLVPLVGSRVLIEGETIVLFGVAFATVRSLGLVITAYTGREPLTAGTCALLIFFFPLFTVGPVERLSTFARQSFSTGFDRRAVSTGSARIALGLFLIMFVCNDLLSPMRDVWFGRTEEQVLALSQGQTFGLIYTSFGYTYLNFVGFSEVAIGTSALFGLRVVENFRYPLVSRNLGEFWKRYHISMGNWINQFLFFPIAVFFKKSWGIYASTIVTFILFGLWHAFTWQYFLWGVANGLGVTAVNLMRRHRIAPVEDTPRFLAPVRAVLGIVVTITFVAWIQTFANLQNLNAAFRMTASLLGF